jgi:hypothetical protein
VCIQAAEGTLRRCQLLTAPGLARLTQSLLGPLAVFLEASAVFNDASKLFRPALGW